jgi:predicted permease
VREIFERPLWIVLAIVVVFLLIATANVGTLLLARGEARTVELATRAAIGGSRGRLLRQLATEGALLSVLGATAGVLAAVIIAPALASAISMPYFTVTLDMGVTLRVALTLAGVVLTAALITGLVPAWRLSRVELTPSIAGTGRITGSGRRLAAWLVAAQMALSLLLVFATGLLFRTMAHLEGINPGFEPDHVVVLEVRVERPSGGRSGTLEDEQRRMIDEYRSLEQALSAIPGVRSAALSWLELFGGSDLWLTATTSAAPEARQDVRVDYVTPRYFETTGMTIVRGRSFTDGDVRGAPTAVIVNETLARQRFLGIDPIGQQLRLEYPRDQQPPFTIAGIVRDSKYNDIREAKAEPMAWIPMAQWPQELRAISLLVRPGAEADVIGRARSALGAADPDLMIRKVTTLRAQVDDTVGRERLLLDLAVTFSGLALLLGGIGLYGTMAYAVARRTRELGIRLALGAARIEVVTMILREALVLVALGAVCGVPLALAAGQVCRRFLFGVQPTDVVTLLGSCALLGGVAVLAAFVPARRAGAMDPMRALRYE